MARDKTLLAQIEDEALDPTQSVADVLRKVVVLGGRAGSTELRDWASKELKGYGKDDELPPYRKVPAVILVDATKMHGILKRHRIAPSSLPDFVQEKVSEEVELRGSVGELEALARHADETGEGVDISLFMAADVARLMNHQIGDPTQNIHSIYWSITGAAVHGVVDQIRTSLAQLVGEIRAGSPGLDDVPSPEVATNAVHVVVTGKRNTVTVTTAQAQSTPFPPPEAMGTPEVGVDSPATAGTAATVSAPPTQPPESLFWTRSRRIGAFIVGVAGVVGAVAAVIALL